MKLGRIERALMGVCCHCRHCLESGCSRIFEMDGMVKEHHHMPGSRRVNPPVVALFSSDNTLGLARFFSQHITPLSEPGC